MKKILIALFIVTLVLPLYGTHDCEYDSEQDRLNRKPKRTCHNITVTGKNEQCKPCGEGEYYAQGGEQSSGACPASYVDVMTYSYIHDAVDFEVEKNNPACTSCGGGATKSSIPTLTLKRYHKYRNMSDRGSFGPGIFNNFDKYFTLYEVNGTARIDYFDADDITMRRYYLQNGVFIETFTRSTKKLELYNASGAVVTDKASAVTAKIFGFTGDVVSFDLFEIDEFTKGARLVSEVDRRGYGFNVTYQHTVDSTVDASQKWIMNTVSDENNRVISFQYLPETRSGSWVISTATIPNGGVITYNYGSASDGALESVTYPDGTQSTFVFSTTANETILNIQEAGDNGSHRIKQIHLDNNFVEGTHGTEGIEYFNAASLLVNAIQKGAGTDMELAFEVLQTGAANGRRIYEGGHKLRESNIISNRYFNNWTFDGTKADETRYTGSQEESWEHGDWKFYSGNAQDRMPLKYENTGLLHRYSYNSNKAATKKIYEDGTFEAWSYNEFNQMTRHRDRLGRVTHWDYDSQGNLLTKTVGLIAQANGTAGETVPGLLCQVYDWTNNTLPTNYGSLTPIETVSVPNLTLDVSDREETFALLFTGNIEIATAGDYTFFLSSDDGSKLYIDGNLIIDNDGLHGNTELSNEVPVNLTAGSHTIRVEFFEKYGQQKLFLKYQGPDSSDIKADIPDSAYSHISVEEELLEEDVTTPETAAYTYTYYPAGHANQYLLATETDANLNVISYTYTADNQLEYIKTMNDDGDLNAINKSYFTYDGAKRLLTSTDAQGRTTTFAYDERDRVKKITFSDFSTEVFFYGTGADANLLVKKKDRNGNTTKFDYNTRGQATTTIMAYSVMPANPTGINDETVNPASLQSLEVCTYVQGTDLKETCTVDGDLTEFFYDYRNRLVETKKHADNTSVLTAKSYFKNNLLQWREDPYGRRTYFSYRIRGAQKSDTTMTRMVKETIPGSVNLPNGYYADIDALTAVAGPNASYLITDYDKDVEGQTTEVTDPRGIKHQTQYDSRGRVTFQISDAGTGGINQTTQTLYDANSNVIEVRNPRYFAAVSVNDRTRMSYTHRNLLESRIVGYAPGLPDTDLLNVEATESYTYYDDGRPETHTDFRGYTTTKVWKQCCGRLGVVAGPAFTDKANNRVRKATIIQYDFYGNQTHTADMVIGENEALPSCCENNPDNTKTLTEITTKFDARHRPIARTVWLQPLDVVDPNDVPIATDPAIGLTTRYHYFDEADSSNSFVSTLLTKLPTEAVMGTLTNGSAVVTENAEGEKSVAIMDGAGRTVASGMLSKTDDSLVTWNTIVHDNVVSNLLETKFISALGNVNKVYTDGVGRRIKSIDAASKESTFFYDNNSNLVSFRDANGVGQDCVFDNLNRDEECTDTYGDTTKKGYDLNNNVITMTDAKNKITNIAYDARNRQTSVTDRINGITSYTYDDNSNVETITDALSKVTTYEYDERNLQIKVTYDDHVEGQTAGDADYGITECKYDALSRKELCIDQKGDNVTYIYDMASRLERRDYRNHNVSTIESQDTFTYDGASRLKTATKGRYSNAVTFTYDEIGRKESETTTVGGNNYTVTYLKYDDDNRLEEVLYPTSANNTSLSRTKLEKSYTNRNQLLSLIFNASPIISNFGYDDGMREETRTFGNGLTSTRAYRSVGSGATAQKDNLLSSITVSGYNELTFSYDYDQNKNVTKETTSGVTSGYSWDTTFDDIDRIDTWTRTGSANTTLPKAQDWTLDKIGNWDDVTTDGLFEDRSHNDAHEISLIAPNGQTSTTPSYDAKGNLLTSPGAPLNSAVLDWDIDNHLVSYTKDGVTTSFTYDALGRRLEKLNPAKNTLYISAGHQVVEEYEVVGAGSYSLARSYVYGTYIDDVVAKVEAVNTPTVLYYHSDRQFNVRALTDDAATPVIRELYAYSPYGKQIILDGSGAQKASTEYSNSYGYTGRYLDEETGLWHFRARYFDNELGRFISRDPLGYVDGMSLYAGYFAQGFNLDPLGTKETDFISKKGQFDGGTTTFYGMKNTGIINLAWDNIPASMPLDMTATRNGTYMLPNMDKTNKRNKDKLPVIRYSAGYNVTITANIKNLLERRHYYWWQEVKHPGKHDWKNDSIDGGKYYPFQRDLVLTDFPSLGILIGNIKVTKQIGGRVPITEFSVNKIDPNDIVQIPDVEKWRFRTHLVCTKYGEKVVGTWTWGFDLTWEKKNKKLIATVTAEPLVWTAK